MDYGKILSRAWEITWRWKILWILGFLVALGRGNGGGGSNLTYSTRSGSGAWGLDISPGLLGILIPLTCLAILIAIALWVASIIARGGLIAGVQQVEDKGDTSFAQAWKAGVSRFWTLLGIGFLSGLPIFLAVLALVAICLLSVLGVGIIAEAAEAPAMWALLAPAFICCLPVICLLVIAGAVLDQIRIYAERAAVLEELDWIDAFKRGWQVLKCNLGPTIVLWLIFLLLSLLLGAVIFGLVMVFALPFIALILGAAFLEDAFPLVIAPLVISGLAFAILGAALSGIVETFRSATWTLAYRQLAGATAALDIVPDNTVPEVALPEPVIPGVATPDKDRPTDDASEDIMPEDVILEDDEPEAIVPEDNSGEDATPDR